VIDCSIIESYISFSNQALLHRFCGQSLPESKSMPIYEYRCKDCGQQLEVLQKFTDPPLVTCTKCGHATLTKLVSAAGFQLKGSGWYQTDFKGSGAKRAPSNGDDAGKNGDSPTNASPAGDAAKGDAATSDPAKSQKDKSDVAKSDGGKGDSATSDGAKATTKASEPSTKADKTGTASDASRSSP